jgi:integrase
MPRVNLTHRSLPGLIADQARQLDYFDDSTPRFGLRVSPKGRRTWFVMYRHNRRMRRLTFGTFPPLSLADARERARTLLRRVDDGYDPAQEKRDARDAETFAELSIEYMTRHAKPKKRSWKNDQRMIDKDLLPRWRHVKIRDIGKRDIRELLEAVADRGLRVQPNRLLALVRKMFQFAEERELVTTNPARGIKPIGQERPRERVLSADEIRSFWAALESETPLVRIMFRLRLLTAQRGAEVSQMRWVDLDLQNRLWTIPGDIAKNGKPHSVPLGPLAIGMLTELQQPASTKPSPWVFPSPRKGLPRRMVQKAVDRVRARAGVDFQLHDLRRTATSILASEGVERVVVKKILNHSERGEVTAVYDRYNYDRQKRSAIERLEARVVRAVSDEPASSVVQFAAVG